MINELSKGVYWVGAVDWDARDFHGYTTERGTTYNAYLIVGEKVTLIDTVKAAFSGELLRHIAEIVDPSKIDYVIANHGEPDHSGSLPVIMERAPNAVVVCTANGEGILRKHYGGDGWNFKVVKQGDKMDIGGRVIEFLPVPMVHWPDSMMSWDWSSGSLFSNDAFGQHYATSARADDEGVPFNELMLQAGKYYANIVMPYGQQTSKALSAVNDTVGFGNVKLIAPSHGVLWRGHIADIAAKYADWSANKYERKALVVYDSMWGATRSMARAIAEGFAKAGVSVQPLDLKVSDMSDIVAELLEAEYLCVGSPTLNNNMMPKVAAFLTYVKGLAPKGRKAFAFGSYGWGGQSVGLVEETLKSAGFEIFATAEKRQYTPPTDYLAQLTETIRQAVSC